MLEDQGRNDRILLNLILKN